MKKFEFPNDIIAIIEEELKVTLYTPELESIREFEGLNDDWNNLIIEIIDYHELPRVTNTQNIFDRTQPLLIDCI